MIKIPKFRGNQTVDCTQSPTPKLPFIAYSDEYDEWVLVVNIDFELDSWDYGNYIGYSLTSESPKCVYYYEF